MSTQRRASRMNGAIEKDRADVWLRTAPLMSIIWLAWAWLLRFDGLSKQAANLRPSDQRQSPGAPRCEATDSLQRDHRNEKLAWLDGRLGSPPVGGAEPGGQSGRRVTQRSWLRHFSILPFRAYLPSTLPQFPAGEVRWAERHDGKRDLYFQHAA
jgi:hypothetical protein